MKLLWDLYRAFFTIGGLTFGGGYAMLPMLEREIVEKHGWSTKDELLNYFAIGQCTPGIIAVNTATFVGYKTKGIAGGIAATLGVISPSIVIIVLIAMLLENFMDILWVQHAFAGIRVCVCVLIFNTVLKLARKAIVDWKTVVIFLIIVVGSLLTDLSPVVFVLFAALCGIVIKGLEAKKG